MNIYLATTLTVLYWIVYPLYLVLYYVALAVLYILAPVTRVVLFVLQPLFYFARLVGACITAPFYFFAKFETLYIYLGVATLTGFAVGLLLYFLHDFLCRTFRIAQTSVTEDITVKQYRERRRNRAKLGQSHEPMLSPVSLKDSVSDTPGKGRRGLLAQTIHEEDSDF
ncbi:hypothetical protein AAFC00_003467 [Neodothiora populina]|uniref:Uncharacterized protein n=1 Tax=Neodothiora populina TaxID=2781224 RepID=A0ABR3PFC5_9PEZI